MGFGLGQLIFFYILSVAQLGSQHAAETVPTVPIVPTQQTACNHPVLEIMKLKDRAMAILCQLALLLERGPGRFICCYGRSWELRTGW